MNDDLNSLLGVITTYHWIFSSQAPGNLSNKWRLLHFVIGLLNYLNIIELRPGTLFWKSFLKLLLILFL